MGTARLSLVAFGLVAAASAAGAHTRIKPHSTLEPRSDSGGNKTGPCGSTPVDESKRKTLTAGSDLKVSWEETIQHASHFRIAFSEDGTTGFDQNVIKDNIVDDQNDSTPDNVNQATFHQFSATIKVPAKTCDKCTLQVIQVMLDNPASPSNYYSCADVRIVAEAGGTGGTDGTDGTGGTGGTGPAAAKPPAPKNLKVKLQAAPQPSSGGAGSGGDR